MDILINPNTSIVEILGRHARYKDKKYRLNKFCIIENVANGKVIMNHLTFAMVYMTNDEFAGILTKENNAAMKFLYDTYFLVEEDFDEKAVIHEIREKHKPTVDDYYLDKISEYTILTTTACNARCFYCYEKNVKPKTMTIETAEKVANYIIEHAPENEMIELRWFGGEPLFNAKVINTICSKLRNAGIQYSSFFTTNGYLFDKSLVKRAKELWHITSCQITLDGTEEVYNKAKNYVYKNVSSPYKKVIGNIAELLDNDVTVSIRMNVDLYNADNLKKLVYELYDRFGNHPNLIPYIYPLFENEFYQRKEGELQKLFEKIAEIEQAMDECMFFWGDSVKNSIRCTHCMVDNGKAVTVSPTGDLGLCEHFVDSDFFGHIDTPEERDMDVIHSYKKYMPDLDICDDCPLYAVCVRNTKCEEQSKCYPEYKEWLIRKARNGIIMTFNNIINQYN